MKKKKEYVAPEMETVELKTQVNLLGESDPPDPGYDDENA